MILSSNFVRTRALTDKTYLHTMIKILTPVDSLLTINFKDDWFVWFQDVLTEYEDRMKKRHSLKIDPACLKWTPFVMPQQQQQQPSKSQPT